jgi:hypothetical protein
MLFDVENFYDSNFFLPFKKATTHYVQSSSLVCESEQNNSEAIKKAAVFNTAAFHFL